TSRPPSYSNVSVMSSPAACTAVVRSDFDEIDRAARVGTDLGDDRLEHRYRQRRVDGQRDECVTTARIASDLHTGDVDAVLAENATDDANNAWAVVVAEEREVLRQREVDIEVIDLHELLDELRPREGSADRQLMTVSQRAANGNQVAEVGAVVAGRETHLDTAILCEQRCIDVGDGLLDDIGEHALQYSELEHLDVVRRDLATNIDLDASRDATSQRGENTAELLSQRQTRANILCDRATLHVDRVGHELARQRKLHRPRDSSARLLLGLIGARAKVRSHDNVVELEQGARRRGLGRENVE